MSDKKRERRRPMSEEEARLQHEADEDQRMEAAYKQRLDELEMLLCILEPINHSAALQLSRFGKAELENEQARGELFGKANVAFLAWTGFCATWEPASTSAEEIEERFLDARTVGVLLLQTVKEVMLGAPPRWTTIMQSIAQSYEVLPPFARSFAWQHEVEAQIVADLAEKTAGGRGRPS